MSYNIFELISMIFKSVIDVLMGKIPRDHEEVQNELIAARKELAKDRAAEIQLERQVHEVKTGSQTQSQTLADLNEKLLQHRFKMAKLSNKIQSLEQEAEMTYFTKDLDLNSGSKAIALTFLVFLIVGIVGMFLSSLLKY